ncbi:MAG: DUF2520 domain-containing protein [Solirubrobacteraceae bacterium]
MNYDISSCRVAVVGNGRAGRAIASALDAASVPVAGPFGRGRPPAADIVMLCVPDGEIAAAAAVVPTGPIVGHCAGACGLELLAPHECFSMHPLMTLLGDGDSLRGAAAAIDASTPRAQAAAEALARATGLEPFALAAGDRAAYHAAASIASNLLLVLEDCAEQLAATAGVGRAQLAPLVRATVANWSRLGAGRALTGPIARGDEATVARQREAVAERAPHLLALWDELCSAARPLAAGVPAR